MKKKLIGIIFFSILFAISSITTSSAKDVIKLTLNLAVPPTHQRWVMAIKPWIDEIETRSEGKVKIVPYFAQALSKQSDIYKSVVSGMADMGEAPFDRKPGQFPILETVFALSTPSIAVKDSTLMFNEFLQNLPQAKNELKEVKTLFVHLSSPAFIGTSEVAIKKMEDFKGLKMMSWGALSKLVSQIGVVPVGMPFPDVYMAIQKGVLDASIMTYTLLTDRKFGKVVHHVTPVTLGYSPFGMVMNKKAWSKLPKDVQNIFDEVNRDVAINLFNKFWWERTIKAKKTFEESMGGKTHYLSSGDLVKMDEIWHGLGKKIMQKTKMNPSDQAKIISEFRKLELKYGVSLNEAYDN